LIPGGFKVFDIVDGRWDNSLVAPQDSMSKLVISLREGGWLPFATVVPGEGSVASIGLPKIRAKPSEAPHSGEADSRRVPRD